MIAVSLAKIRLSEQNTKQKGKFFYFCLYFRAKVPSTGRSKVRLSFEICKKKQFFSFFAYSRRSIFDEVKDVFDAFELCPLATELSFCHLLYKYHGRDD